MNETEKREQEQKVEMMIGIANVAAMALVCYAIGYKRGKRKGLIAGKCRGGEIYEKALFDNAYEAAKDNKYLVKRFNNGDKVICKYVIKGLEGLDYGKR